MKSLLLLFALFQTILYASYNPFFSDAKPSVVKKEQHQVKRVLKAPVPIRKDIKMTYFGFVESHKGKFALVRFNHKNIVIRKNDSLYAKQRVIQVKDITSNRIILKDSYGKIQAVYFSSTKDNQNSYARENK
ncbi:MAG: hypothetical protein JJW00_03780 [Sulfurimonas sp.]|nr:hypothetical protein [Sulfurimonas sp.]